jgi:sugar phosphate isomerase/epimerase
MSTPTLEVREAIKLYASIGFEGIELICDDEYHCAISHRITDEEIKELKDFLDDCNLQIAILTPYIRDLGVEERTNSQIAVEMLKGCVDIAFKLDCPTIRVWAGGTEPTGNEWEDAFKRTVEALQESGAYSAEAKRFLAIENHKNTLAITSEDTLRLVQAVDNEYVGILYDPANLILMGGGHSFKSQAPHIRHVHVKDMRIFNKTTREYIPVLMGEGEIPWPEIMKLLKNSGYDRFVSVEYEKRWHGDALPDTPSALRHELKSLRGMIGA